jgi:hypothetical protein
MTERLTERQISLQNADFWLDALLDVGLNYSGYYLSLYDEALQQAFVEECVHV